MTTYGECVADGWLTVTKPKVDADATAARSFVGSAGWLSWGKLNGDTEAQMRITVARSSSGAHTTSQGSEPYVEIVWRSMKQIRHTLPRTQRPMDWQTVLLTTGRV